TAPSQIRLPGGLVEPTSFETTLREPKRATTVYRLLGYDRVALSRRLLEQLGRDGLMSADTKVFQDGEGFATALSSRPEFRHLVAADASSLGPARAAGQRRTPQKSPR